MLAAEPSRAPLSIERLCVRRDRVEANVRVEPGFHLTTPEIARRVAAAFPTLASHACVNDVGPRFGAVMDRTPLPHLLEHLVIDLQVRACEVGARGTASEASGSAGAGSGSGMALAAGAGASLDALLDARGNPADALPADDVSYCGTTAWLDEAVGLARVEVSFTDDLVALRAFRDATDFLNRAVLP